MAEIIFGVLFIAIILSAVFDAEDGAWESTNPPESQGGCPISFDEFLRLFEKHPDQFVLHPTCVDCRDEQTFRLSFSKKDWKKYQEWYRERGIDYHKSVLEKLRGG